MEKGFQRTFINDIYHIEPRLQEYDPDLYLLYHPGKHEWILMDGLIQSPIMKIPQIGFETLDARLIEHVKKIHTANGFSAIAEIEANQAQREREDEKKIEDMAYWMAKDLKKPLKEAADYGRMEGYVKDFVAMG